MTNEQLIEMLQEDLKKERMHCFFYQQAAAMVQGLHREELRELFLKEAQSELIHVDQFSALIVNLGGVPSSEIAPLPDLTPCPGDLCLKAAAVEQQVADIYAERLRATHEMENAATAYVHVFYEDQINDSQKAAWEFSLMAKRYQQGVSQCQQNTNLST
jgi:bacterioferritin